MGGEHRARPERHHLRPAPDHPLELGESAVEIRERQVRDGEYPVLVREPPLVVEPAVKATEDVDGGLDIRLHQPLHAHPLGREQPRRLHALFVHDLDPGVPVEPLGMLGGLLAGQHAGDVGLRSLPGEVVEERAGARPRVDVAGTGHPGVELVVDDVPHPPVDLLDQHAPVGVLGVAVSGEGVARLPVVVVGVEDGGDLVVGSRHVDTFFGVSDPRVAG